MDRRRIWEEARDEEDLRGNEKQGENRDEGDVEELGKGLGLRI